MAKLLVDSIESNSTLFCLDLRQNLEISQKTFRQLAVKMLASYSTQQRVMPESVWQNDQKYFNPDFLAVEIPQPMVKTYVRKIKQIQEFMLSPALAKQTSRPQSKPSKSGALLSPRVKRDFAGQQDLNVVGVFSPQKALLSPKANQ